MISLLHFSLDLLGPRLVLVEIFPNTGIILHPKQPAEPPVGEGPEPPDGEDPDPPTCSPVLVASLPLDPGDSAELHTLAGCLAGELGTEQMDGELEVAL